MVTSTNTVFFGELEQEKKSHLFSFYWFIFLFTCIFPPMYFPVDVRLIIGLFWIIMSGMKARNKKLILMVVALFSYSYIVYCINLFTGLDASLNIPLRYLRSLLMIIAISAGLSTSKAQSDKVVIVSTLSLLLTIQSSIIILEIIFPSLKSFLYIFAGSERIFYQYRAGGFVNSFDFAGFYTTIGTILCALLYCINKRFIYYVGFIINVVGTVFTSRLNMAFCLIALIVISLDLIGVSGSQLIRNTTLILTIGVGSISILMWAITTDALTEIRSYLFSRFDWMPQFYTTIRNTYSDDNLSQTIATQFSIDGDSVFKIFGTCMDPNRDPGYIQMLYSIGLVGLLLSLLPYISIGYKWLLCIMETPKPRKQISYERILIIVLGYVLIYELIMNFKILFLYSTGAFEILIIIYMLTLLLHKKLM